MLNSNISENIVNENLKFISIWFINFKVTHQKNGNILKMGKLFFTSLYFEFAIRTDYFQSQGVSAYRKTKLLIDFETTKLQFFEIRRRKSLLFQFSLKSINFPISLIVCVCVCWFVCVCVCV